MKQKKLSPINAWDLQTSQTIEQDKAAIRDAMLELIRAYPGDCSELLVSHTLLGIPFGRSELKGTQNHPLWGKFRQYTYTEQGTVMCSVSWHKAVYEIAQELKNAGIIARVPGFYPALILTEEQ